MINIFIAYPHHLVLKSLTYFEDADTDLDLKLLQPAPWKKVKSAIEKAARTIK